MSVTSLLFCIVPLICINLQVSNQVQIQNSWIHNTKLLCVKQNASYVANSKCNMELVSRSTELSNIDIVLQPNVVLHNLHVTPSVYLILYLYRIAVFEEKWFQVLVSTNHRSSSLQYRPVLVNYRANLCEAISSKKFILPINTTSNILKGCPYRVRALS